MVQYLLCGSSWLCVYNFYLFLFYEKGNMVQNAMWCNMKTSGGEMILKCRESRACAGRNFYPSTYCVAYLLEPPKKNKVISLVSRRSYNVFIISPTRRVHPSERPRELSVKIITRTFISCVCFLGLCVSASLRLWTTLWTLLMMADTYPLCLYSSAAFFLFQKEEEVKRRNVINSWGGGVYGLTFFSSFLLTFTCRYTQLWTNMFTCFVFLFFF